MADVDAEPPGGAPQPLGALIARLNHAVAELAAGAQGREAMHALRSSMSEIAALTEQSPRIERAI